MNTNNQYGTDGGAFDSTRRFTRDLASRGMDAASEAQRHIGEYAHATGRYVANQPLKSALIAAAVGAAVAALVLVMRRNSRSNSDYYYY
jgi:ElaB/YqjD/DUF883 family membrane-anchored ribosome-binding protein